MSHRGIKALREEQWRKCQYRDGREDGLANRQGRYSDQYYMRGWRSGQEARKRVRVVREQQWLGRRGGGFGIAHEAIVGDAIVGRWYRTALEPYIGDSRGVHLMRYRDWLAAVKAYDVALSASK